MGLKDPLALARTWVEKLDFNVDYDASTFETTIRYVIHTILSNISTDTWEASTLLMSSVGMICILIKLRS